MHKILTSLKDCFVAHPNNYHEPHFLRRDSFLFFSWFVIIIELVFLVQVLFVFDKTNFLASVLPGVLVQNTNESRLNNNAGPLFVNDLLQKAAELKAQDMALQGYFAHNSPDGKTPWYWLDQVGYRYSYAGENLAVNFFESADISIAWMNSPSHRANIIKQDYTEIGIGIASGFFEGKSSVFVVQFFGKPNLINTERIVSDSSTLPPLGQSSEDTIVQKPVDDLEEAQVLGQQTATGQTNTLRLTIQKILSSPLTSLNYLYLILTTIIVVVALLIFLKKHHINHRQVLNRALALVAIILIISFVNAKMINFELSIPTSDISANTVTNSPR